MKILAADLFTSDFLSLIILHPSYSNGLDNRDCYIELSWIREKSVCFQVLADEC